MDQSKYGYFICYLNCSWTNAVCGFWTKYPNVYSNHVLSEDVLERKVLPDGKLYTRRLLRKTNHLPNWGSMVFSSHLSKMVNVVEEAVVDPKNKEMKIYTWNTTYTQMMDVHERMTITSSDHERTMLLKEGWIDSSLKGFRRVLRKFGFKRWQSNAQKAYIGYQHSVEKTLSTPVVNSALKEKTFNSINDAKDKAKLKAINLAAKTQSVQP